VLPIDDVGGKYDWSVAPGIAVPVAGVEPMYHRYDVAPAQLAVSKAAEEPTSTDWLLDGVSDEQVNVPPAAVTAVEVTRVQAALAATLSQTSTE
jgi:hypothetical protein